ncbi:MAG: hypothetical protein AAF432_16470, partial [Planctomycetota bacterium]
MSTSPTDPLACDSPLDVAPEQRPRHIAMIMDGNGRWVEISGFPQNFIPRFVDGLKHRGAA